MDFNTHFGRIENKQETERIIGLLPQPLFALSGAESGAGQDVFLWKAEESLTGTVRPPDAQTIGDCVSHGFGDAIDDLRWVRIAWQGDSAEDFVDSATEVIYAGSRVQIGRGGCGRQDGSVGAWALKWIMDYGIVPRGTYGAIDLTSYSGKRAREWGMPNAGCPSSLLNVAKQYPLKTGSLVRSYEEVRDAIAVSKSPVTVSSNQGFEPFVRGKDGFIRPGGTWPHCMYIRGVTDNPKRPGVVVQQSWGPGAPTGPLTVILPHGLTLKLYEGMFLVDAEVIDRMVSEGDSFALSDMVGFPKKDLPELSFF